MRIFFFLYFSSFFAFEGTGDRDREKGEIGEKFGARTDFDKRTKI